MTSLGVLMFSFCIGWLRNVQSFRAQVFHYNLANLTFCHMNATLAGQVTPPWDIYMANDNPGWQVTLSSKQGNPLNHVPTYHVNMTMIK